MQAGSELAKPKRQYRLFYDPEFEFDAKGVFTYPERGSHPGKSRYELIHGHVEKLVQSILSVGVLHPVVVTYYIPPKYHKNRIVVHPGQSRCKALRILGETTVPAIIVDHTDYVKGTEITLQEANDMLGSEKLSTAGKWHDKRKPATWHGTIP